MTTPKKKPPLDADRSEKLHDEIRRGLDGSLAVQGTDEERDPAASADDEAIRALDAGNGDPVPDDESDAGEEIPLPAETLARGARRP